MHDFLLEVSQGRYKGVAAGTVRDIVAAMSEEGKERQTKIIPQFQHTSFDSVIQTV